LLQPPVSDEIATSLARFFFNGAGPSHTKIGNIAAGAGYAGDDPYSPTTQSPNKEVRVLTVLRAARRRPDRARELVEALLVQLRVHGCFDPERNTYDGETVGIAQRAFRRAGWILSDDGELSTATRVARGGSSQVGSCILAASKLTIKLRLRGTGCSPRTTCTRCCRSWRPSMPDSAGSFRGARAEPGVGST
jgi:hypothetical protein